jgi:hypothetical protein
MAKDITLQQHSQQILKEVGVKNLKKNDSYLYQYTGTISFGDKKCKFAIIKYSQVSHYQIIYKKNVMLQATSISGFCTAVKFWRSLIS